MRESWIAKHSVPLKVYEVHCPECAISYKLDSAVPLTELWCPFCESEDSLSVKEIKGKAPMKDGTETI